MKKIYVHGSFRGENFGDYLLFKLADHSVKENGCTTVFDHVSNMYKRLNPVETKSILGAVFSCDAVLCAGGGFLGEPKANDRHWNIRCLYFHIFPLFLAVLLRKPIAIIGTEIGDISSPIIRLFLKSILHNSRVISVRNVKSKNFIESIYPSATVDVHPDWVLTSKFSQSFEVNTHLEKTKYFTIFLHLMQYDPSKLSVICDGINTFIRNNENIRIIVGYDHFTSSHKKAVEFMLDYLKSDNVEYHDYNNDPQSLINVLNSCDCIMTTKLHVGICGVRMGVRVISLPCHPKIKKFFEYINYDMNNVVDFNGVTDTVIEDRLEKSLHFKYNYNNTNLIEDADHNSELLSKFLDTIQ